MSSTKKKKKKKPKSTDAFFAKIVLFCFQSNLDLWGKHKKKKNVVSVNALFYYCNDYTILSSCSEMMIGICQEIMEANFRRYHTDMAQIDFLHTIGTIFKNFS